MPYKYTDYHCHTILAEPLLAAVTEQDEAARRA